MKQCRTRGEVNGLRVTPYPFIIRADAAAGTAAAAAPSMPALLDGAIMLVGCAAQFLSNKDGQSSALASASYNHVLSNISTRREERHVP